MDFRSEVKNDALADAVTKDYRTADLTPPDRALCDYAIKLTRNPGAVTRADVDALRKHGFDDRAIHDAVQTVAYFNYINRVADGLGIDLEPGMPPRIVTPDLLVEADE